MFINDKLARATRDDSALAGDDDWTPLPTVVELGASIGFRAVVLAGVTIWRASARRRREPRSVLRGDEFVGNPARVLPPLPA